MNRYLLPLLLSMLKSYLISSLHHGVLIYNNYIFIHHTPSLTRLLSSSDGYVPSIQAKDIYVPLDK
jgi:hypothetical protein